jgi:hypothetical protein
LLPQQNLSIFYQSFSIETHLPDVSACDLAYDRFCAMSLAFSLFLNKRFKRGIIGKYHITFAGTFIILGGVPSGAPGSSSLQII